VVDLVGRVSRRYPLLRLLIQQRSCLALFACPLTTLIVVYLTSSFLHSLQSFYQYRYSVSFHKVWVYRTNLATCLYSQAHIDDCCINVSCLIGILYICKQRKHMKEKNLSSSPYLSRNDCWQSYTAEERCEVKQKRFLLFS